MPSPCAVVTISSHVSAGSFPFVRSQRTSSSRISAAVPGIEPSPWALHSARNSPNEIPSFVAPFRTSIGLNAWTWISGAARLHGVEEVEVEGARQVGVDARPACRPRSHPGPSLAARSATSASVSVYDSGSTSRWANAQNRQPT